MTLSLNVLGVIPARGGSKGVPRKNIRLLNGRPLISYTIDACQRSEHLARFTVSTEDDEIAQLVGDCQCHVTRRPAELASDTAASLPVVQHALLAVEQEFGQVFDAVCLLQPTTPLRRSVDIDQAIQLLADPTVDAVVSVTRIPDKFHPNWAFQINEEGHLVRVLADTELATRRQLLQPTYFRNGAVYAVKRSVLIEQNSLYGNRTACLEMDPALAVNIDTPEDWELAERRLDGQ